SVRPRCGSARLVRRDDDLDALELLEVGVPGRGHRAPQRADEVERAVRLAARAEQDLLQRARRADADALAARELRVVRLGTPVPAVARRLLGAREGRAEHHGVRAARDGLDEVARAPDAAVRDDVDVPAARL